MPRTASHAAGVGTPSGKAIASHQAILRLALASGDERLAVEAESGRNRYGVPPRPAPDELWFASSTASPISEQAQAAASAMLETVLGPRAAGAATWPEQIRERLHSLLGIAGSAVVLAGSGTEAELIVLALARAALPRPITSVVVAPTETGSGVILAADGRHFLDSASLDPRVTRGAPLAGFEPGAVAVESVAIRSPRGMAFAPAAVDGAVADCAGRAVAAGRDVLIHCLDCSKTGLSGLQRPTAAALQSSLGGHALVVVDACQLRCSPDQIRRDLAAGFLVMITGSKFAGGPPFAGAVLVPPGLVERLGRPNLPAGLAAYSARFDWPTVLRPAGALRTELNLGLCLRWEAALAELEPYFALSAAMRADVARRFQALLVRLAARAGSGLVPVQQPPGLSKGATIFPFFTTAPDGHILDAQELHRALRTLQGRDDRVVHLGQPVAVGLSSALRVCLAAPQVTAVAARIATGVRCKDAMAPLAAELDAVFAKWATLRATMIGEPGGARRRA